MDIFSKRYGYVEPNKEISIREDAPESLRVVLWEEMDNFNFSAEQLRSIICNVLRCRPDSSNWSPNNVWNEARHYIYSCVWFKIYDIIESFSKILAEQDSDVTKFTCAINECLEQDGIGWKLVNNEIVARGSEEFETATKAIQQQLIQDSRPTAASHIKNALNALSQRPQANTSGAVSHATSAIECVLSDVTGENMTLGKYLDKHPTLFHPALKKALDGIYGYASDAGARHGKEGKEPSFDDAQFLVWICTAVCGLLTRKHQK